jgi:hypothetical protein
MAGGTEAFHPNDYSKASLGRHSKCNTKNQKQNPLGKEKPKPRLKRTRVREKP